jgi:hypothetical protein
MRIWGYDRDSVEAHLGELEQELERLEAARNAAAAGPELVGVGERVEAILAAAREAAANATGQAAEQAAKLTRESEQAAEQLRKEADEYATTKRKEADAYEASSRTETQRKVEELRQRATAEAEAATAAAEEEAEEILREAHLERGRIEDSIAELRERRQQVIASIEDPAIIERILEHLGRDGGTVDPAHPGQAKRRRRQSRAPPEVGRLI